MSARAHQHGGAFPSAVRLRLPAGAPKVALLDAREAGVDEAGLRAWARAQAGGAEHSSRSYRYPYALIAGHTEPVGVDIERAEPTDDAFLLSISTPEERARLDASADPIALWSSKEALAKALGDAVTYDPRRLISPSLWPGGRSGPWRVLSLPAPNGHVAWLCWRDTTATSGAAPLRSRGR